MSSAAQLRGRKKSRARPVASRRHGTIDVLPHFGSQCSLCLVAAISTTAFARALPAADQALIVVPEFTLDKPCST